MPDTRPNMGSREQGSNDMQPCEESDFALRSGSNAHEIAFSLIMPTYNRKHCIARAIDSILAQRHGLYEIIVIDDGSDDGTCEYLEAQYAREITDKRIILVRQKHCGVSTARNKGLQTAHCNWICYLDTDNEMDPSFFHTFSCAIAQHPGRKCFYAKILHQRSGTLIGKEFNLPDLFMGNYIDLNAFVHANMFPDDYLIFNPRLTRVVDYEFILKFCTLYEPVFIDTVVISYDDSASQDRITISEDCEANLAIIRDTEMRIKMDRLVKEFQRSKELRDGVIRRGYRFASAPVRHWLRSRPRLESAMRKIRNTVYQSFLQ